MLHRLIVLWVCIMLAGAGKLAGQTLDLGPDTVHCNREPLVLDAGPGFLTYQWSNGNNTQTIIATQSRIYWVEVTDSQSVLHRDSIRVTLRESPNAAFVVDNVCFGTPSPTDDRSTYVADTIVSWFWDFGDGHTYTTQLPTNLYGSPGIKNISLVVTNTSGCMDTASGVAEVYPPPMVNAGIDDSINVGDSTMVVGSTNVFDYRWSPTTYIRDPQQLNITVYPPITTVYTLTAIDTIGCTAKDDVIIYVNQAPVAVNDQASTPAARFIVLNVLANDSDPNDDSLTVTILNGPLFGSATVDSNENIIFSPSANFNGRDTIFYQICDNFKSPLCDSAYIVIYVTNAAPNAINDVLEVDANNSITINVLTNDSDPNEQLIFITAISTPGYGEVEDLGNGLLRYTPNAGYFGVDSFYYVICDNGTPIQCDSAWVIIQVNESPLEIPNSFSPNNDGFLDTWYIRGLNAYSSNYLAIFTKWGEIVLETDNYQNNWNGKRGFNEELPEGIYYYKLILEDAEPLSGYIMLKR
ncbi:hypothetical protein BH09BAC1_BH09BAC1_00620 [soil metagenome]